MSSSVSARLNANLLDENYERWLDDPCSVDGTWAAFFEGFELGVVQALPESGEAAPAKSGTPSETSGAATVGADLNGDHNLNFLGRVVSLIYNYRTLGHTQAHINPLEDEAPVNPRLELSRFGITEEDLDRPAATQFFRKGESVTLREMVTALQETYSGSIGFEFMHIHNTEVRNWLRERIEHAMSVRVWIRSNRLRPCAGSLRPRFLSSSLGSVFWVKRDFRLKGEKE